MAMSVPKRIKFWRKVRELTQEELGQKLAVSQATMFAIEQGKRPHYLDADSLALIAAALNIPVEYLHEEGPDPLTLLHPSPAKKERIRA